MAREDGKKRFRGTETRNVTPEGRAAQAAAGRRSLPAMLAANKNRRQDTEAIEAKVEQLIAAAIEELGGEENLTARQRLLLVNQRLLLLTVISVTEHIARTGAVGAHGRVRPILATVGAYVNSLRLNTESLGLPGESAYGSAHEDPDAVIAEIKAARGVSA